VAPHADDPRPWHQSARGVQRAVGMQQPAHTLVRVGDGDGGWLTLVVVPALPDCTRRRSSRP
jgi:hypothetical protein